MKLTEFADCGRIAAICTATLSVMLAFSGCSSTGAEESHPSMETTVTPQANDAKTVKKSPSSSLEVTGKPIVSDLPTWNGPFDLVPTNYVAGQLQRGEDGCYYLSDPVKGLLGVYWPSGYSASTEGVLRDDGTLIRLLDRVITSGPVRDEPFVTGCVEAISGTVHAYPPLRAMSSQPSSTPSGSQR